MSTGDGLVLKRPTIVERTATRRLPHPDGLMMTLLPTSDILPTLLKAPPLPEEFIGGGDLAAAKEIAPSCETKDPVHMTTAPAYHPAQPQAMP